MVLVERLGTRYLFDECLPAWRVPTRKAIGGPLLEGLPKKVEKEAVRRLEAAAWCWPHLAPITIARALLTASVNVADLERMRSLAGRIYAVERRHLKLDRLATGTGQGFMERVAILASSSA